MQNVVRLFLVLACLAMPVAFAQAPPLLQVGNYFVNGLVETGGYDWVGGL